MSACTLPNANFVVGQCLVGSPVALYNHKDWYDVQLSSGLQQYVHATLVKTAQERTEIYSVRFWDDGPWTIFFGRSLWRHLRLTVYQVKVSTNEEHLFLGLSDEEQIKLLGF